MDRWNHYVEEFVQEDQQELCRIMMGRLLKRYPLSRVRYLTDGEVIGTATTELERNRSSPSAPSDPGELFLYHLDCFLEMHGRERKNH